MVFEKDNLNNLITITYNSVEKKDKQDCTFLVLNCWSKSSVDLMRSWTTLRIKQLVCLYFILISSLLHWGSHGSYQAKTNMWRKELALKEKNVLNCLIIFNSCNNNKYRMIKKVTSPTISSLFLQIQNSFGFFKYSQGDAIIVILKTNTMTGKFEKEGDFTKC